MLLETISVPLSKALQLANSTQAQYAILGAQNAAPSGDGVLAMGHGGQVAANRLKLVPFGMGVAGQQFSMRLYSWNFIGPPDANPNKVVWVPMFLAEFVCVLCNQPGPGTPPVSPLYLSATESLCDTVVLTRGQAGPWFTAVNSTGPGTDLIAWALVDVVGSRYLQFDFQLGPDDVSVSSMNCLWSLA